MTISDLTFASRDFAVVTGDCLPLAFRLLDGVGTPIVLTGYGAVLTLSWAAENLVLSTDNGRLSVADGEDGAVISGAITQSETAALPQGRLTAYRLKLIEPGGCTRTVLGGYLRMQT